MKCSDCSSVQDFQTLVIQISAQSRTVVKQLIRMLNHFSMILRTASVVWESFTVLYTTDD